MQIAEVTVLCVTGPSGTRCERPLLQGPEGESQTAAGQPLSHDAETKEVLQPHPSSSLRCVTSSVRAALPWCVPHSGLQGVAETHRTSKGRHEQSTGHRSRRLPVLARR